MGTCKHGLDAQSCEFCINPHPRKKGGFRLSFSTAQERFGTGAVVVSTQRRHSFSQLGPNTKFVHIDGFPLLWTVKRILRQAPNVQTIEVTPLMEGRLGDQHRQACAAKGVRLTTGYVKPEIAAGWKDETEPREPEWRSLRNALLALTPEQRERLNELLALGFEQAQLLSRYFCLNGEKYISQRVIAQEFGYAPNSIAFISAKIRAVIHYLKPEFKVSKETAHIAWFMEQRILRLRARLARANRIERLKALALQLGLEKLPEHLPLARLETFESLIQASLDGQLHNLQKHHPNRYRAIALRFGLEGGEYLTLEEVGNTMGGITKERVRQHEEKALKLLGIQEDT